MTKRNSIRLGLLLALIVTALLAFAGTAFAGVAWRVVSNSNTNVVSGEELIYNLQLTNAGHSNTDESTPITLTATLPPGFTGVSADTSALTDVGGFECPGVSGATVVECTGAPQIGATKNFLMTLTVAVTGPERVATAAFDLEGGAAGSEINGEPDPDVGTPGVPSRTVDPTTVTPASAAFGFDALDLGASTPSGEAFTHAAGHPHSQSTAVAFATHTNPSGVIGPVDPVADVKDITVDLPSGLVGNPAGLPRCQLAQLVNGEATPRPLCSSASQAGTAVVDFGSVAVGPIGVFNMVPPPGTPARFAFDVSGTIVVLDAHLRSGSDYGLSVSSLNTPQALQIVGSTVEFWGVPAAPSHEAERGCPGQQPPGTASFAEGCSAGVAPRAFFRMPTSCTAAGLPVSSRINSWQDPGTFDERTIATHEAPGYPYPEAEGPLGALTRVWGPEAGVEGCDQVPFEPTLDASLSTDRADSPTGLNVDLGLPADCWDPKPTEPEALESICQSDMREARVTLPQGMSINPSAAGGRAACSPSQIGLSTPVSSFPVHFDQAPAACPDASKIGTVEIETPLLSRYDPQGNPVLDGEGNPVPDPLTGSVYLASQGDNPFGSLLAIYLVAEGSGVVVKQAGEIELGPDGQITTVFHQTPQTPFSKIHLELFGGERAALRTPSACGTYAAHATLTPWSGNAPAQVSSSFGVTQGCGGGFSPQLEAGAQNPLAGATSPFNLRLSRDDASQELAGLQLALPPGLSGYLKGIPYCSDSALAAVSGELGTGAAQEASPSCPAASQIGTVAVGAGAGATPFYTQSGRAYLAGPYKGAPLSIAVIAPAVAGPFDLGSVVVRNAIRIDPESGALTVVSDPIPHILHGIPLDLRDVRVQVNRNHFTLNPTSCEPMQIGSRITSTSGASADPSVHFQVAGCERLAFKPRLGLRLFGKTNRGAHPKLRAVLAFAKPGGANLASAQVALPHSEFLDQAHIRTICTRVQFAAGAGGGSECPKGSVYGTATATSPIVDYAVKGPVYLRSSNHKLPDLVLALRGPVSQPVQIDAVGRIDSIRGGIRTTFESTPDLPLDQVTLTMKGGKKGLIQNSRNICAHPYRATAELGGQNGKALSLRPALRDGRCGPHGHGPHGHRPHKHRGGHR